MPSSTLLPFLVGLGSLINPFLVGLGSLINPFKQKRGTLFHPRLLGNLAVEWHRGLGLGLRAEGLGPCKQSGACPKP